MTSSGLGREEVGDTCALSGSNFREYRLSHGDRSIRAEISAHVLCTGRADPLLGMVAIRAMPTDIFPQIRIPVVTMVWSYTGLSTPRWSSASRPTAQYSISANVNGIKHRSTDHELSAGAEDLLSAGRQSRPRDRTDRLGDERHPRALMPPGIQPPIVVQFNALSAVGILDRDSRIAPVCTQSVMPQRVGARAGQSRQNGSSHFPADR